MIRLTLQPSLEQRIEQKQELRQAVSQELQQRIQQRLMQQIKQEMTLKQYLEQEDFMKGLLVWAEENNAFISFNKEGFNFRYALVPYSKASFIADRYGPGFAHCQYEPFEALIFGRRVALAKGDWTLFVVKDMIPANLREPVALHERGEEISLGDHFFASQLEFAFAKKKRFLKPYTQFIDENHPSKFIDLTQRVLFPILPEELVDYLQTEGKGYAEELARAEALIKDYPLSPEILKKMECYEIITEKICKLFEGIFGATQMKFHDYHISRLEKQKITCPEEIVRIADDSLRAVLKNIHPNDARVVSCARVGETLLRICSLLSRDSFHYTERPFYYPEDFSTAYQAALNNRPLITSEIKVEDGGS